jgi:hypothetical protein
MAMAKMPARSDGAAALRTVVGSNFFQLTISFFSSALQSSSATLVGERYIGMGAFSYLVFASINLL